MMGCIFIWVKVMQWKRLLMLETEGGRRRGITEDEMV